MKYLFLFFTFPFYGQILHHQMISSQGITTKTNNGYTISQTIGQQSTTGNSDKGTIVVQGFQQSLWGSYIALNEISKITVKTFPNPFDDWINFQFSTPIENEIAIYVFDISGRLVYNKKTKIDTTTLTINLAHLPRSQYLVQLQANNSIYYSKIIKL